MTETNYRHMSITGITITDDFDGQLQATKLDAYDDNWASYPSVFYMTPII